MKSILAMHPNEGGRKIVFQEKVGVFLIVIHFYVCVIVIKFS